MIDLHFGVTLFYRRGDIETMEADAEFAGVRDRVLERDGWTCQACGCQADGGTQGGGGGLEVHHLDGNHGNNDPANLAALCPLCHGIFHIGFTARRKPGRFIWLPEASQADLNLLVHAMAVARLRLQAMAEGTSRSFPSESEQAMVARLADTLEGFHRDLSSVGMAEGVLVDPESGKDLKELLEHDPSSLGSALADIARAPGDADLGALREGIAGLRWLYQPQADAAARHFQTAQAWLDGKRWMDIWRKSARRILKRQGLSSRQAGRGRSGGGPQGGSAA